MPRTVRLAMAAVALAGVVAPASAAFAQPDPPCKVIGGPHLEYHDGMPVIVVEPYQPVCY